MKNLCRLTLGVVLAVGLTLTGCSSNKNPTTPPSPTPSGPYLIASLGANGFLSSASVLVSDSTGNSGTANTSVTLTTGGVSEPLTTVGPVMTNSNTETIEGAPLVSGYLYSGPLTYSAGQTYVFDVVIGGASYSASVTGLAGNPVVSISGGSAGVTCSWTAGIGNENHIHVFGAGLANNGYIGPPLSPNPYVIPNSFFTNETPGMGSDGVNMVVSQVVMGAFPGAQSLSCVISRNVASDSY